MKKIFMIVAIALAWVSLATCPAYADGNEQKQDSITNANQVAQQDVKDKPQSDVKNDKQPKTPIEFRELDIAFLVLLGLCLLLIALLFYLTIKTKGVLKSEVSYLSDGMEHRKFEIQKLDNSVQSAELNIGILKNEILKLKQQLEEATKTPEPEPIVEVPVAPQAYPEKVWYGKYTPSLKGFSVANMTEEKLPASQFEILQTSETTASYIVLTTISNDVLVTVKDACNIIEGDTRDYSRIQIENKGQLVLDGNTWEVVTPVSIKLI